MAVKFEKGRPLTSATEINEFEKARSLKLPVSYKEFLLRTNGGRPEAPAFPIRNFPEGEIGVVQVFFGIGVKHPTSELAYNYDLYEGGFPFGIVPIACNDGGDYICLDLRNNQQSVAFLDNRHFWGNGEWRERDLYHIANSFEEFLGLLRASPF